MVCPIKAFYRYLCRDGDCRRRSFVRDYSYRGYLPKAKQQIADMSVNGSGIRDTSGKLKISPTTVIQALKKHQHLKARQLTALLKKYWHMYWVSVKIRHFYN
ncbi:MAG TPA: IS1-like element transposase [Leptolyngbyaceae cyanobacterium]